MKVSDRARKNAAVLLKRISEVKATNVARRMGVHESRISRWKSNGDLILACTLLAGVGLKIVPVDTIVFVDGEEVK